MKLPASPDRRVFLAGIALATALLAGCKPSGDGSGGAGPIKVGEFASITGSEAAFGNSSHNGTALAIEEINKAGGVLGRPIELITEDNQSKQGESVTIVKKFISRDQVSAVLGEVASGRSLEAAPVCQEAKIPMVSPSSTNPKVTETGDYVFRVCFIDPFQGGLLADFAKRTLKARKVAILSDVSAPYSVGLAEFFEKAFRAGGGEVVIEQRYASKDKDFRAQLTAIKAVSPDAIFVPGYYTEAGLVVTQARQLGITVPIFGGDGWEAPELIQIAGSALENTYYSTHYSPEAADPKVQAFVKAYQAKYGGQTPDAMAALGYDSALVLADAIQRAGSTEPAKVRDALAATKDFPCVTGKTTLDAQRNATKSAVIITVKDGKFKYVETINP
ncbi:MAG: ABC transporter substrate-binding protein [Verrucomicrobiales bacterium]|nr:ABC transporter substrate-binding protein [Verrucomicrobiales bacterium]